MIQIAICFYQPLFFFFFPFDLEPGFCWRGGTTFAPPGLAADGAGLGFGEAAAEPGFGEAVDLDFARKEVIFSKCFSEWIKSCSLKDLVLKKMMARIVTSHDTSIYLDKNTYGSPPPTAPCVPFPKINQ